MTPEDCTVNCPQEGPIKVLQDNYKSLSDKITGIDHAIRGNGTGPGMRSDLAVMVTRTNTLEKSLNELKVSVEKREDDNGNVKRTNIMLWLTGIAVFVAMVVGGFGIVSGKKDTMDYNKLVRELRADGMLKDKPITTRGIHYDSIRKDTLR